MKQFNLKVVYVGSSFREALNYEVPGFITTAGLNIHHLHFDKGEDSINYQVIELTNIREPAEHVKYLEEYEKSKGLREICKDAVEESWYNQFGSLGKLILERGRNVEPVSLKKHEENEKRWMKMHMSYANALVFNFLKPFYHACPSVDELIECFEKTCRKGARIVFVSEKEYDKENTRTVPSLDECFKYLNKELILSE